MNLARSSTLAGTKVAILGLLLTACSGTTANIAPTQNPSPPATSTAAIQKTVPQSSTPSIPGTPIPQATKAVPRSVVNAAPVQPQSNGPRLQAKIESVDYGDVPNGDIVDQTFEFTNVGNQPLVMDKISIKAVEGC